MRMSREHVLRALYELSEPQLPARPLIAESQLIAHRAWNGRVVDWLVRRAESSGLVERSNGSIRLTTSGLAAAAEVTRAHRLWEMFLVESAGIARDHVDRDADDVEHMLPKPLIGELERRLEEVGKLPVVPAAVPVSPHEIAAE